MEYVCRIGTPTGEVVEQTFNATDESVLRAELEQKGFYVFSLRRSLSLKGLGVRRTRIPNDLLLIFAQELAALLKAGLPLVQSLEIMLERQKHETFRRSLTVIGCRSSRCRAISSDRLETSMPTISVKAGSCPSSRSSFPSPQPRSSTL